MDVYNPANQNSNSSDSIQVGHEEEEEMMELRRGPWTVEEDYTLMNYIAKNGEGRWNSLARCAGLKRTGKSCRLRWLNYLRPDVRRGNITLEEQLLILELHSRWGNRWSKIAQQLPGRTDNEIKNYWRTRVQKHAKQLKCDVNSKQFKDTVRYLWMPRLVERIQAATTATSIDIGQVINPHMSSLINGAGGGHINPPDYSSTAASSDSFGTQISPISDLSTTHDQCYNYPVDGTSSSNQDYYDQGNQIITNPDSGTNPCGYFNQGLDFHAMDQNNLMINQRFDAGYTNDNQWNVEDIWFLQQQLDEHHVSMDRIGKY